MGLRLKLSRAGKIALLTLLMFFAFLLTPLPVSAGYWRVNVLIAYDEEWEAIANNVYWYSPRDLAQALVYVVSDRFWRFNIKFYVMGCVTWDSDDDPPNADVMSNESIEDTGFQSGMLFSGYVVHVLVAFTGQDIPGYWGVADVVVGAVLVQYVYLGGTVGQATDNVLQHELSHLYDAEDHNEDDLDCVMNGATHWIQHPYYGVPTAFVTENWCSDCCTTMMNHSDNWGYWDFGGGGSWWIRFIEY